METIVKGRVDRAGRKAKRGLTPHLDRLAQRLDLAVRAVMLGLGATTAVAVGFLIGIGIDFIALLDKWTILTAIMFYATVVMALVSPLLAIPTTLNEAVRPMRQRLRDDRPRLEALQATRREVEDARAARDGCPQVDDDRTVVGRLLGYADPNHAYATATAALQAAEERRRRAEQALGMAPSDDDGTWSGAADDDPVRRTRALGWRVRIMEVAAYAVYALAAVLIVLNVMATEPAVVLLVVGAGLAAVAAVQPLRLVAPWVIPYLLAVGFFLGRHAYDLPPNIQMVIEGAPRQVRILLSTAEGVVVIGRGPGEERQLVFVPRSQVGSAVLPRREPRQTAGLDWVMGLKPFVWIAGP